MGKVGVGNGMGITVDVEEMILYRAVDDIELAGDGVEEGGFSGAAWTGNSPLFALFYFKGEVGEEGLIYITYCDVF